MLAKYEKAKVAEDDKEGDFDARYEQSIKEKMDEWKRGYYKVRNLSFAMHTCPHALFQRANWKYPTTIHKKCMT